MSTTDRIFHSRWWLPAVSLVLGAIMFAAFVIGGNTRDGLQAFAVMAGVSALFAFGASRSETLGGLGGPGRDERWAMIDLRASALAGFVLITVVIGAWLYEIANGEDGSPYAQLGAIAGLAYIVGLVIGRARG